MNNLIATNLINHRNRYFIASVFFILLLAYGATDLKSKSGYRIFFDHSNPQLANLDKKEAAFTKGDDIVFALESRSGDIFTKSNLLSNEFLTKEAWLIPNSSRVNSLSNFQHSSALEDELIVDDLVKSEAIKTSDDIENIKSIALNHPEIANLLSGKSGRGSIVQVKMSYSDNLSLRVEQRNESVTYARKLASKIESENSDLKVHLIGRSLLNQTFEELAAQDVMTFIPVMFLLIIVLMWLLTRSVLATLSTLIVISCSAAVTHGFMGWVGFTMNQANSQIPVVVLTISICNCIHLINTYTNQLSLGLSAIPALKSTIEMNFKNVLLTNLTTIIGFLCLNFSDIPPYRELGNSVAFGIFSILILTFTMFPFLVITFKVKTEQRYSTAAFSKKYVHFLLNHQKKLFVSISVTSLVLSSMMFTNEVNDDLIGYFGKENDFRIGASYLQKEITGFDTINFMIDTGQKNGITNPALLAKLEAFEDWLYSHENIVHVKSITQIFKRLNKNMHNDDSSFYKLPESKELAAQYILLYEMSLPYGLGLDEQLTMDKSATLVSVALKHATTNIMLNLQRDADVWIKTNIPSVTAEASSVSLMFAHIGYQSIYSMLYGSVLALALISIVIMCFMRSIKYGIISLIPNALPALVAFGLWGIIVGEVDMPVAVIFSVTLGIIVDDTVHFLGKYVHAKKSLNYSTDQSLEYAFTEVGNAIIITTITIAGGFLVLGCSDFVVNATFGLMVATTIILALVLDFILLPLILKYLDDDNKDICTKEKLDKGHLNIVGS